jgi:hypothetical protein
MHHHRRRAVPAGGEVDEALDVLLRGHGHAVDVRGDIVDRQDQVVGLRDMARPRHDVGTAQQRDDMAGLGLVDRGVQAGQ